MRLELKTFQWNCDCCSKQAVVQATAMYNSRPAGWITHAPPDSLCLKYDYCTLCQIEAKEKHQPEEDNHYGQILRYHQREKASSR